MRSNGKQRSSGKIQIPRREKGIQHIDNVDDLPDQDEDVSPDEVVYESATHKMRDEAMNSNRRPSPRTNEVRNLSDGFERVAPSTWTNQYNSFLDQITRMKSELMQLGEENEDLVSMIQQQ